MQKDLYKEYKGSYYNIYPVTIRHDAGDYDVYYCDIKVKGEFRQYTNCQDYKAAERLAKIVIDRAQ